MHLVVKYSFDPSKGDDKVKADIVQAFMKNVDKELNTFDKCLEFANYLSDFSSLEQQVGVYQQNDIQDYLTAKRRKVENAELKNSN